MSTNEILKSNGVIARTAIEQLTDPEVVKEILAAETKGKGRKVILEAARSRLAELVPSEVEEIEEVPEVPAAEPEAVKPKRKGAAAPKAKAQPKEPEPEAVAEVEEITEVEEVAEDLSLTPAPVPVEKPKRKGKGGIVMVDMGHTSTVAPAEEILAADKKPSRKVKAAAAKVKVSEPEPEVVTAPSKAKRKAIAADATIEGKKPKRGEKKAEPVEIEEVEEVVEAKPKAKRAKAPKAKGERKPHRFAFAAGETAPVLAELGETAQCPHCGATKDIATGFGFRRMGSGVKRQPWCRSCRNDAAKAKRAGTKVAPSVKPRAASAPKPKAPSAKKAQRAAAEAPPEEVTEII